MANLATIILFNKSKFLNLVKKYRNPYHFQGIQNAALDSWI